MVMANYEKHGTDLIVDLQHHSLLDPELAPMARADAEDARAHFRLELREGELWAVDVKWTADGEERIRSRKQRYISPAFWPDPETKRVVDLVNCALVSMPATHGAEPLIAAKRPTLLSNKEPLKMNPELLTAALDALIAGDTEKAAEILKSLVVAAATGGESAEPQTPGESEALAETAEEPPTAEPGQSEPAAEAEAMRQLSRLVGKESPGEVLATVRAWKASRDKAAKALAALDETSRLELVGELVKLGREEPSTAWDDPDKRIPARIYRDMPISELRSRVEKFRKLGRVPSRAEGEAPPASSLDLDGESRPLSPALRKWARANNMTEEEARAHRDSQVVRAR